MKTAVPYTLLPLLLLQLLQFSCTRAAFVSQVVAFPLKSSRIISRPTTTSQQTTSAATATTSTTRRMLSPMDISEMVTSASSMWISTIDSDIANIPQNEFATIFTGGLVVMSGGLLSALMVGFILESRNLYASVVVDSYVDSDSLEDEEFWKNLSEEEQKKTRQVLDKIKQQKQGGGASAAAAPVAATAVVVDTPSTKTTSVVDTGTTTPAAAAKEDAAKVGKKMDMFSDYGD